MYCHLFKELIIKALLICTFEVEFYNCKFCQILRSLCGCSVTMSKCWRRVMMNIARRVLTKKRVRIASPVGNCMAQNAKKFIVIPFRIATSAKPNRHATRVSRIIQVSIVPNVTRTQGTNGTPISRNASKRFVQRKFPIVQFATQPSTLV